jgi:aldose 1-epimerase
VAPQHFGRLPDERDVHEVSIGNEGISARIITYGAILRDLALPVNGRLRSVVLGFDGLGAYLGQGAYIGAIAGRYANRIAGGRFTLDGKAYQLNLNEGGKTHLHGGKMGFDRKLWTVATATADAVSLALHSPAGEEGYPGAVEALCTYRIIDPLGLAIELTATTDAPTVINLTGHSYFNLDGGGDIRDHRLMIPANEYLPVSGDLIPDRGAVSVVGTAFDFRTMRPIRDSVHYDNTFVTSWQRSAAPRLAARLASATGDLAMDLLSTEPGVQFYDGAFLDAKPYGGYGGLCLEPQCFPDTPNHPEFPSCVLRPGATYRHIIEHRFIQP